MLTLTSPVDIDVPTVTNLNNKNNVYEQWRLVYINSMAGEYYSLTFILMTNLKYFSYGPKIKPGLNIFLYNWLLK